MGSIDEEVRISCGKERGDWTPVLPWTRRGDWLVTYDDVVLLATYAKRERKGLVSVFVFDGQWLTDPEQVRGKIGKTGDAIYHYGGLSWEDALWKCRTRVVLRAKTFEDAGEMLRVRPLFGRRKGGVFLGCYAGHDLYFSETHGDAVPTVTSRYGYEEGEYCSGSAPAHTRENDLLEEALRRAVMSGLFLGREELLGEAKFGRWKDNLPETRIGWGKKSDWKGRMPK